MPENLEINFTSFFLNTLAKDKCQHWDVIHYQELVQLVFQPQLAMPRYIHCVQMRCSDTFLRTSRHKANGQLVKHRYTQVEEGQKASTGW